MILPVEVMTALKLHGVIKAAYVSRNRDKDKTHRAKVRTAGEGVDGKTGENGKGD